MQSSNELKCLYFSLGVIKQATREFSDQNLLGEDGFGDIYRGNISINDYDYVVAVKRFHKESEIMFRYEIDRLSPFHHRNIISLLGYCEEEYEKILVYELLPNGSLYDYLLSGKHRVRNLTVAKRLEICIETANGLSYLHFGTRFIHGDVNTCNIFLDDNLVAKLLAPPFTSCLRGLIASPKQESDNLCYHSLTNKQIIDKNTQR
ncbi:probable receptor-like protein kinase At4g39110 [Rutidosis leptorrhynchoides]|uniref:probable receptor-like protein kinase At4g39110 n=1 Tax=Rutidosis leptorrhynchoides TaxID=125765 RepID=UPI003A98FBC9